SRGRRGSSRLGDGSVRAGKRCPRAVAAGSHAPHCWIRTGGGQVHTLVRRMPGPGSRRRPVVIGSGPTGVACAWALVERGLHPIVVDGGRRLEPEREAAL